MKRPFHKHIAYHTRRYSKHLTKYLYERDTIFATLSVFIFLILLGMIPINFYVLNPMKMALKDFDFNDIAYSKGKISADNPIDNRIVIVNIGHRDREEIAYLIEKISTKQPKIIGLDALFETENDLYKDSILRSVLLKTKNLVAGCYLIPDDTFKVRKDYFEQEDYTLLLKKLIAKGFLHSQVPWSVNSIKKHFINWKKGKKW
jgi:hypothetical protein